MMNNLLPTQLYADIKAIKYSQTFTKKQISTIKDKTIILVCELLWHIIHNGDILSYKEISYKWMLNFVGKNNYYLTEILLQLENNDIFCPLKNDRGTAKYSAGNNDFSAQSIKYMFNNKYFNIDIFKEDLKVFKEGYKQVINHSITEQNNLPYQPKKNDKKSLETLTDINNTNEKKIYKKMNKFTNKMKEITVKSNVSDFIKNYKIDSEKIQINGDAILNSIKPTIEFDGEYRGIEWLYNKAKEQGKDFIIYKDEAYIENINDFIERKSNNAKINMLYNIQRIENKDFYSNRNQTNNRLDTNITNMKSELRLQLLIDGEEVVELDIYNAQFAILSYLFQNKLDKKFIELSQNGELYQFVGDNLYPELTKEERRAKAKKLMMLVAFDKPNKYQTPVRKLFPKTMQLIDKLKENNFKEFSIKLQTEESNIMVDGLLAHLNKKYTVFTIHDALLVRVSEKEQIKKEMNKYFSQINFKCTVN